MFYLFRYAPRVARNHRPAVDQSLGYHEPESLRHPARVKHDVCAGIDAVHVLLKSDEPDAIRHA